MLELLNFYIFELSGHRQQINTAAVPNHFDFSWSECPDENQSAKLRVPNSEGSVETTEYLFAMKESSSNS